MLSLFYTINVREYRKGNQNGQSRETGNIVEKQNKTTTQYALDTTICKQAQIT